MSIYTFESVSISSINALKQALNTTGHECQYAINGDSLSVESDADRSVISAAVAKAETGTLFSAQTDRIAQVSARSAKLAAQGVACWSGGKVELNKALADQYFTDTEYFEAHPEKLNSGSLYYVPTLDGRGASTYDINDIIKLADDCADRLFAIYSSDNGAPKGEFALVKLILGCQSHEELDAIIDERA